MNEYIYLVIGIIFDLLLLPNFLIKLGIDSLYAFIFCTSIFVVGCFVFYDAQKIGFLWGKSIRHGKTAYGVMIIFPLNFPNYIIRRKKFLSKGKPNQK